MLSSLVPLTLKSLRTYVNTEGRVQVTRAATSLPGAARDDWKIIRADQ